MSLDHSRRGKAARRKGSNGELEVRDLLRKYGFADAHRQFQSGGQGGGDLADAIPDCHIEVKRHEACSLPTWWRQATASARPTDLVVIAHRANGQPWQATLLLTDALELLRFFEPINPVVISRSNPRAEWMALHTKPGPGIGVVIHPVAGLAMVTMWLELFLDWQRMEHGLEQAA